MPPVKGKTKPEVEKAQRDAQIAAKVDELGRVEKRLEAHRLYIALEDKLRRELREIYSDHDPFMTVYAHGREYTAVLGPRANQKTVDAGACLKALGVKAFAAIAKVSISALEGVATPAKLAELVSEARTGPRSLRIFAAAPAGEEKRAA